MHKKTIRTDQEALVDAFGRLENFAYAQHLLSKLPSAQKNKPNWERVDDVKSWIELASVLYLARRITRHEYVFYCAVPIETLHEHQWMNGLYPEMKEIDRKIRSVEKAQKYNSDEKAKTTFEALAREWHEKGTWVPKNKKNILSALELDVLPHIGHLQISKVTTQDIIHILLLVEQRGAYDVAKRICQRCEAIFDYAMLIFPELVLSSMSHDDRRSKNNPDFAGLAVAGKFKQMFDVLEKDDEYQREYEQFVKGVSYASEENIPSYKQALNAVRALAGVVTT